MYANFDGIWAAWNLQAVVEWGIPFDLSPFNPFSGLGSVLLPNQPWLNPGALVFALPLHRDLLYVLSYAVSFTELTISFFVLLRAFGLGPTTSAIAAQLNALLLAPPWDGYFQSLSWFALAPVNIHLFAVCNFGLVVLLHLGRHGIKANLGLAAGLAALALSGLYSAPVGFLTYVPAYAFMAVFLVAGARPSRVELAWKVACVAALGVALWLAGFREYLAATAATSARAVQYPAFFWPGADVFTTAFWAEAWNLYAYCGRTEVLLCPKVRPLLFMHVLGVAGAVVESLRRESSLRTLAWGYLLFIVGLHFYDFVAVKMVFGRLHVISTPFLWWAGYSFLSLFAACFLLRLGTALVYGVSRVVSDMPQAARAWTWVAFAGGLAAPLMVPVFMHHVWTKHIKPYQPGPRAHVSRGPIGHSRIRTPKIGPIAEYLREHASVAPGMAFRGYTVTYLTDPAGDIAGVLKTRNNNGRTWQTYVASRDLLNQHFDNMFQDMDLWSMNVPTLEDYGQWISKQNFQAYKSAFSRPEDHLTPLVLRVFRLDLAVLRRLGARFIISDAPLADAGLTLRATEHATASKELSLSLYEITGSNLSGIAVTSTVYARTINEAMTTMRSLKDRSETVLHPSQTLPAGTDRVIHSELRLEKDGFRIVAQSAGRSSLVLPVQFSNCWKPTEGDGMDSLRVRRADAILTMVEFSGKIDARFRLDFGPPFDSRCRLADAQDFVEAQ